jgi:hypothetical protein
MLQMFLAVEDMEELGAWPSQVAYCDQSFALASRSPAFQVPRIVETSL